MKIPGENEQGMWPGDSVFAAGVGRKHATEQAYPAEKENAPTAGLIW